MFTGILCTIGIGSIEGTARAGHNRMANGKGRSSSDRRLKKKITFLLSEVDVAEKSRSRGLG